MCDMTSGLEVGLQAEAVCRVPFLQATQVTRQDSEPDLPSHQRDRIQADTELLILIRNKIRHPSPGELNLLSCRASYIVFLLATLAHIGRYLSRRYFRVQYSAVF